MSQNGKLTPNLDEKSTKVLNLTVLQRIDPFVEEILITAAHVTLYEFNIDNNQWSRKDVEGSLFVVKRNTQPRFQFIVMNRRNTDNLVENLLEDFEYEVQVPYLLYRNASQEVNGIWFYNARECEHVANLFNRILNAYVKVPTKSKVSPCKSDFAELEAVPSRAVMDGPLEPTTSTPSSVPDIADDRAFVNFFSTAMDSENAPIVAISGQPYQYPSTVLPAQTVPCMGSAPNVATVQPYQSPANIPGHPQGVTLPTFQVAQTSASCKPVMSILDNPESGVGIKHSTDLVKPSSFVGPSPSSSPLIMPPITSSVPTAPPMNSIGNVQQPYGTPLLQPFPPPTPPPSFTPGTTTDYGPMISRERIRNTLQILVQDAQFIDFVYQAINNARQS